MKTSVNQGDNHLTTVFWAILAACFADIFLAIVTVKTYRLIRDYNLDHGHSVVGSTLSGILLALFVVVFAVVFSFRAGRDIVEYLRVGSPSVYSVSVSYKNIGHGNVGNEWSFSSNIDGISIEETPVDISLSPKEIAILKSVIVESDEALDDVGKKTSFVFVREDSFTVEQKVKVTENGGRNKGESVTWLVTYSFNKK